jgi:aspartyl-tRNA(Asn)/glutamyl-tRNA(Gln) amidotransferase subunit A
LEKFSSFDDIQRTLKKGESDCRTIVHHYLENIQTKAHLNAFVEVYAQSALAKAAQVDEKLAKGNAGKLAGMVIGIKDVLNYEGHPCTAGSHILKGYISQYTATAAPTNDYPGPGFYFTFTLYH